MSHLHKIALLGIYHESNTFVETKTDLEDFRNGHFLVGDAIRQEYRDAHHEIGGMLEVLDRHNIQVVPVMYAEATPGGTITAETYAALLERMWTELEKVLPIDGCLVVPHGAGVSEDYPDMDGHWLQTLRQKVGNIPIVGTLDLHANVSPTMVESTDVLVAYRQNPHIDQREMGMAAANLLVQQLNGKIQPRQVLVQPPLAISIEQQFTKNEPCKSLYAYADRLSQREGILSISIQLGFPYADVAEMGTSFIIVSDNDPRLALETGQELENYLLQNKESFVGEKIDIPAALDLAEAKEKPVLLLDMGDNIGGGSPANNIALLEALERKGTLSSFVCIYDPNAVSAAAGYSPGETFSLNIAGTDRHGKKSFSANVRLLWIKEGDFQEDNARHGGQVNYHMGKTALVVTDNGNTVMLTSLRIPPFSLKQLTAFDVVPESFDVIVAKGVIAPIAAYSPVCPSIIQVNTPGVTQADMTLFHHQHRRKPMYPFEEITVGQTERN